MASSLLCETVTGATMAELVAARDAAVGDMVELRLDGVADLDVARALGNRRLPAVVTCRPRWEGGAFTGSEDERRAILELALKCGAERVDVEFRAGFTDLIRHNRARVIVSSHDFSGVPRDLAERVRAMRATGAEVIKIAVTATRLSDTLPLIDIARGGNAVVIGMGEAGIPSRLLATTFGSRWTYAGDAVAPGQIPARRMVEQFRFRGIGPKTAIYGVVGNNVAHSISPAMHNAAFGAAGIDAVYVPLRAADFGDFLAFADALGIAGASVTIPFKLDALEAAASCDELTRAAGAANTLKRWVVGATHASPLPTAGPWEATNTDIEGFLEPLDDMVNVSAGSARPYPHIGPDTRVSVLGAGGAARAVIVALLSRGAQVTVHSRRRDQAEAVAAGFGLRVRTGSWPPQRSSWDILVNCTPLGSVSARGESPLPYGPFDGWLVYDLTYGPEVSPLLQRAGLAGCATLDGLPMLIAQAERQFEWWTGTRPAEGVMRNAVAGPGVPALQGPVERTLQRARD